MPHILDVQDAHRHHCRGALIRESCPRCQCNYAYCEHCGDHLGAVFAYPHEDRCSDANCECHDPVSMQRTMTTDEATALLAGGDVIPLYVTPVILERTNRYIRSAQAYGFNWDIEGSERQLRRAYAALHAEYPPSGGTGYHWHIGVHPIQLARGKMNA